MPLPSFCPLFFLPSHRSLNHFSSMLTLRTRIRHPKWLLLLAAGEGKRALFTIWQSVRPPASRLHDAQNCPACYRTVILPSLHDASSDTPRLFLFLVGMVTLFGACVARMARSPLLTPAAPRGFSVHLSQVSGLPVIRNNSPSPLLAFWFAARFAGPLFMTKISECNAFELTQSEVQRPDIGCCFTGYDGIFIV